MSFVNEKSYTGDKFLELQKDSTYLCTYKEYCEKYAWGFPVIVDANTKWINRVHPLKQKLVLTLYHALHQVNGLKYVILFGSSVNPSCTYESDLDLAIRLQPDTIEIRKKVYAIISGVTDGNFDLIWINDLTPNDKIAETIAYGVKIYE